MQLGLNACRLCPRRCGIDRRTATGFCGAPADPQVAAVCLHRGEEPPLSDGGGIVNVFFAHCNLHCAYCQNGTISARTVNPSYIHYNTLDTLADSIGDLLPQGNGLLGFVTASHYAHLLPPLVDALRLRALSPTVVYNSSGYESVDTLRMLEGTVDIYLPDLKYMDPAVAEAYSQAPDYPEVAAKALMEMQRQVGASLKTDERGIAYRGLVVRHLVLPGHTDNSLRCLEWIADNLPTSTHVSLMAQYYPPSATLPHPIDRPLTAAEYALVADRYNALGFAHGWLQELEAGSHYRPDFSRNDNPFEPQYHET